MAHFEGSRFGGFGVAIFAHGVFGVESAAEHVEERLEFGGGGRRGAGVVMVGAIAAAAGGRVDAEDAGGDLRVAP